MAKRWNMVWLIAVLLTACAGTAPNVLHVQAVPGGASSTTEEINDRVLARRIAFGEVSVRPLGLGSSMEVQVQLENRSVSDVVFEYRFVWYDSAGFELSSLEPWLPAGLGGREKRGFKATAPDPTAASFRFMVRNMNPITDTGS